jgi:GntR family transcriptional repressor for pyruvate dehydrogenase complex
MFQMIDRLKIQNSNGLYKKIVDEIRGMVVEGKLKAGEKLPSERELADQFGVSRVPVREALKTLEFMGIVQYVRGDGIYVHTVNTHDLLQNIEFAIQDNEDVHKILEELFEVREAIEIKATQLAAVRRTEQDLEILQEAVWDMERDVQMRRNHKQSSLDFHTGIIKASKNKILCRINEALLDLHKLSRQKSAEAGGRGPIALDYHRKLLQAIRDKDADKAGNIMCQHLHYAGKALGCNCDEEVAAGKTCY